VLLTLREYEDLLLHMQVASQWMQSDQTPGLWLRSGDGPPTYAVLFAVKPEYVDALPISEDGDEAYVHFLQVLRSWTCFAERERLQEATKSEDLAWDFSVSDGPPQTHVERLPPMTEPSARSQVFALQAGGYVRLDQRPDDTVVATISIPTAESGGTLSFDVPLRGFVRAQDGRTRDVVAKILEAEPRFAPRDVPAFVHPKEDA